MSKPNNFTDRKEELMLYLFAWKHKQPFVSKFKIKYYPLLKTHFIKLSLSYNITSNVITIEICSIVMKSVPTFLLQEKKTTFWHNRKAN